MFTFAAAAAAVAGGPLADATDVLHIPCTLVMKEIPPSSSLPACLPARLDCPPRLLSFLPSSKKRISDGDNLSHLQSWFNEQACGKTAASDVTGRGRSGAGVSRPSFPRQHGRTDGPTTYYIRFKGRQARQGNFVALKRNSLSLFHKPI